MFEYNPAKSAANLAKHGIDFEMAQLLWSDDRRIELETRYSSEERLIIVGMIENKHWAVVITIREAIIRIISARRARISEARAYDSQKN
jgi:uncharacterized protein